MICRLFDWATIDRLFLSESFNSSECRWGVLPILEFRRQFPPVEALAGRKSSVDTSIQHHPK
jgi:hypothetical protein